MSAINPIHSLSGFAHEKLDSATHVEDSDGALNKCKIAGGLLGHGALLVASAIETVVRYVLAYGSLAVSCVLSDEKKQGFKDDYVTPFFQHAALNAGVFSTVKNGLTTHYNDHVAPFLKDKVETPA